MLQLQQLGLPFGVKEEVLCKRGYLSHNFSNHDINSTQHSR